MKNRAEYRTLVDLIKEENRSVDMTVTPPDPYVAIYDYERDREFGEVCRLVPLSKIATPIRIQRYPEFDKNFDRSRPGVFNRKLIKFPNVLYDVDQDLYVSYDGNHTASIILMNSGDGYVACNVGVLTPGTDEEQLREIAELFQKTNDAFTPLESYTKFRMKAELDYADYSIIWDTLKEHGFNLFCKKDNPDKISAKAIGNISNVNGLINLMENHWKMVSKVRTEAEKMVNETAARELAAALTLYREIWPTCPAEWPTISHLVMLLHRDRIMGTSHLDKQTLKGTVGPRSALEVHKVFQKTKKDTKPVFASYLNAYKVAYGDAAMFAKILIDLGYPNHIALPGVRLK